MLDIDYKLLLEESLKIGVPILLAGAAGLGTLMTFFGFKSRTARKDEANISFGNIVSELTLPDTKKNIAAAIKIRRFFSKDIQKHSAYLHREAVNVISSLSRVLPTGVFQKTLVDGLAFARNLSHVDFVGTNLQDVYMGIKKHKKRVGDQIEEKKIDWTTNKRIFIHKTDFYSANLSYSLFEYAKGAAIFSGAIMCHARFKNCDLRGANFQGADLSNIYFNKVRLTGANFKNAENIPVDLKKIIEETGFIYQEEEPFTSAWEAELPEIFFSIPSVMSDNERYITNEVKSYLTNNGFKIIPYTRDDYPCFGQIEKVAFRVKKAVGMVVFGYKQTYIKEGCYRPNSPEMQPWKDKWLPSPWNEIEVGMAAMKDIPILIIKDDCIDTGIFDNVLSEVSINTLLLSKINNLKDWNECQELHKFVNAAQ